MYNNKDLLRFNRLSKILVTRVLKQYDGPVQPSSSGTMTTLDPKIGVHVITSKYSRKIKQAILKFFVIK